jgi:hypothetical protein
MSGTNKTPPAHRSSNRNSVNRNGSYSNPNRNHGQEQEANGQDEQPKKKNKAKKKIIKKKLLSPVTEKKSDDDGEDEEAEKSILFKNLTKADKRKMAERLQVNLNALKVAKKYQKESQSYKEGLDKKASGQSEMGAGETKLPPMYEDDLWYEFMHHGYQNPIYYESVLYDVIGLGPPMVMFWLNKEEEESPGIATRLANKGITIHLSPKALNIYRENVPSNVEDRMGAETQVNGVFEDMYKFDKAAHKISYNMFQWFTHNAVHCHLPCCAIGTPCDRRHPDYQGYQSDEIIGGSDLDDEDFSACFDVAAYQGSSGGVVANTNYSTPVSICTQLLTTQTSIPTLFFLVFKFSNRQVQAAARAVVRAAAQAAVRAAVRAAARAAARAVVVVLLPVE